MSDQPTQPVEPENPTPLEELSDDGAGAGVVEEAEPNTFEPEEDPEVD